MRIKIQRVVLFLFMASSLLPAQQRVREKDLMQQYRDWLQQTQYIMHPEEREVFLLLSDNRERDIFIETFWKQRDPTPGTPQNEYKDEHIRRFQYANKWFTRGSSKPGWMTDMGRIYIILGEPVSKDRYPSNISLYPCEVWSYYGDVSKGLPNHFSLVFFQRQGVGEYKLYDPVSDGPAALLIQGRNMDPFDYEGLFNEILEVAPGLALVSLSLIPGEFDYGFLPNPRNAIILADILESPRKSVNPAYSTHFLNLRGVVSTEYLTNFVENSTDIAYIQDPLSGIRFLHFSIAPASISIDYYEPNDQYFCSFTVNVSLKKGENTIFQYDRQFPFYFAPNELDRVRANGIALEDSFPVAAGQYELNILLTNSVGKEFTVHERTIFVPEIPDFPTINGPFLGYRFHDSDVNQHMPFKTVDRKLLYDPKKTFSRQEDIAVMFNIVNMTEDLWRGAEVKIVVKGLSAKNTVEKTYTLRLENYPFRRILNVDFAFPAQELTPDYYELKMSFVDGAGRLIDEKKAEFAVSPSEEVSHPIARMKPFSLQNQFLFYYMLAEQYNKLDDYDRAEENYAKAYSQNKTYTRGVREYAFFELKNNKFERALELVENIKQDENLLFDYYLIKGQAHSGMGLYMQAIDSLEEGNKIYNSDTRLLNSLGFCYYKTAQKSRALEVLKASLRVNPEQENVKKLLEEIERDFESPFSSPG
jgi:GWxTD domain-containing protein